MKFLATLILSGLFALPVFSQGTKPKSTAAKPKAALAKAKPSSATAIKPGEKTEWEKTQAIVDLGERIAAIRKFVETFPRSTRKKEAAGLLVTLAATLGNEKLQAGDVAAAAELFKAAAKDAAKPISDQLFNDTLSKFAANLYFRGLRTDAFEIAKTLEEKVGASAGQLLSIAGFYMSVENGSEAKRVAESVIRLDANSAAAYQTLGLASRMDFQLDESAAAYAKALELEPDSLVARRGLAEMKRSLGKADEAAALYREILAKDEGNVPARTGLVLSLFDAGKREEAEAELAKSLEANPGNVILLAGAAYWYAVHDEGDKAVELASRAIAADPRFVWSHIALARGLLSRKDPVAAEKTLLAARRYGNFPTLDYEIASARLAAGYYREAAEELAKSFTVKDGVVHTKLGGRVTRESRNFTELVGFERRASIFAPTAADNPENAAKLTALLELKQELEQAEPKADIVTKAADEFVKGGDKMKVHRLIFAANELLEKKTLLPKALEFAKAAPANIDAGLDGPTASIAVLASEIYETRSLAAVRGDYVNVPDVPRGTLSAILRGRIEEITGWAAFQMNDAGEAAIRLKRAVGILPADSAWWRSSTWRLATALESGGKDAEALEMYIKSYKSTPPNTFRYSVIENLYKRINGKTDGLEMRIGPNPAPRLTVEAVAQTEPTPEIKTEPTPSEVRAEPTPEAVKPEIPPSIPVATPQPTPDEPKPIEIPASVPVATPKPTSDEPTPDLTVKTVEFPASIPVATPKPTPDEIKIEPIPTPTPVEIPTAVVVEASPTPTPDKTPEPKPMETPAEVKSTGTGNSLFPPIVITIPAPSSEKIVPKESEIKAEPLPTPTEINSVDEPKPSPTPSETKTPEEIKPTLTPTPEPKPVETTVTEKKDAGLVADGRPRFVDGKVESPPEIKPCKLKVSEDSITLQTGGGDLALIVGLENDGDLEGIKAVSTSPDDVSVRREAIAGVKSRALFVVRAISDKAGVFQIRIELPCGKKEIVVNVR